MQSYNNLKSKTIINSVPIFLDFCKKEKHFSPSSITNYQRFLNVFIEFLKEANKIELLPYQLDGKTIHDYKTFILNRLNSNGKPLKRSTQNYYLIALRSLVSFLDEKDIKTLNFNKIILRKEEKTISNKIILNSEQIKILRAAPDIHKINGLRDKAIIELLLSTGLKISQLTNLNRNQIEFTTNPNSIKIFFKNKLKSIFLNDKSNYWINKYLKSRKDNETALFINYQGRKHSSRRLTNRSIERIIKKYVLDNNLPSITPESLRNTIILNLYNKSFRIYSPAKHKLEKINFYKYKKTKIDFIKRNNKEKIKSWHDIEKTIQKEMNWLKEKIDILPKGYKKSCSFDFCDECLLRKIASLIVSSKIKATEYKTNNRVSLWCKSIKLLELNRHGQEWHRKMMKIVASYFKEQNCKIILEPILNYGRADLGIHTPLKDLIIIEIGTVSLLKLWYNLSTTKNLSYFIIPYEDYIIEFKV